ncbi:acyl-CoA dehydrogenase [Planococcus sp. ISL-109]|uniref:acyl-CoA dehydrogenase family protein n=1 Tax=Planococcus sp. ISL-109 TaxID=2819166 RepID=UPI001BEA8AAB|nr:acyl-CoA dehydrogenase [Planococcus sp. ISL-109]MBT2583334.1 hypothetical protein [Planococcus sp. ISL-109]
MSEMKEFIMDSTEKILRNLSTKEIRESFEEGDWASSLWDTCEEAGLTLLGISEEQGGVGGDFEDVLGVLYLMGKYAAPVPLLEVLSANAVLASQGMEFGDKKRVIHFIGEAELERIERIPFARYVEQVVVIKKEGETAALALLDLSEADVKHHENLAAEPRDSVNINAALNWISLPESYEEMKEKDLLETAAGKSAQMTGAMEAVLNLSVFYSKERKQFGRPLHKFQAIQHHLTSMAGEYAAAYSTLQVVAASYEKPYFPQYVAMMKTELSKQANTVAKAAHQLHAGIGMTYEHELHHFTRRLWAWRDEAGNETYWTNRLAELYMAEDHDIWEQITHVKGDRVHAGFTI